MIEIIPHGTIHEIKLARPPVNALNYDLLDALVTAITQAPGNGARAIVISGNQKVFSGGLDVPYLLNCSSAELKACWSRFFDAARALAKSPIPVAAAISGHNPAGGCVLALCCDYRVMAEGPFRIGLNETQVGLAVPEAIQYLMRRIVGAHRAERLIVAGAMIESAQAHTLGIIDELGVLDFGAPHLPLGTDVDNDIGFRRGERTMINIMKFQNTHALSCLIPFRRDGIKHHVGLAYIH